MSQLVWVWAWETTGSLYHILVRDDIPTFVIDHHAVLIKCPIVELLREVLISALMMIHPNAIILTHERLFVSSESKLGVHFGIIFCRLILVLLWVKLRTSSESPIVANPLRHARTVIKMPIGGREKGAGQDTRGQSARSKVRKQTAQKHEKWKRGAGREERRKKEAPAEESRRATEGKGRGGYAPDTSAVRSVGALKHKDMAAQKQVPSGVWALEPVDGSRQQTKQLRTIYR